MSADEGSESSELPDRVRAALDSADLAQFADLLDPNVRWGAPDDPNPPCRSRGQVLAWFEEGRAAGRRARVVDVHVHGDKLLVELMVVDAPSAGEGPTERSRWQVLTCAHGRIVDIRGYDSRARAVARF